MGFQDFLEILNIFKPNRPKKKKTGGGSSRKAAKKQLTCGSPGALLGNPRDPTKQLSPQRLSLLAQLQPVK